MAKPSENKIEKSFQPGDKVLKLLPREKQWKLSLKYDGPYTVKKRLSPESNVYVIVDDNGTEETKSATDLKKFIEPKHVLATPTSPAGPDTLEVLREEEAEVSLPRELQQYKRIIEREEAAKKPREEVIFDNDDSDDEPQYRWNFRRREEKIPAENGANEPPMGGHGGQREGSAASSDISSGGVSSHEAENGGQDWEDSFDGLVGAEGGQDEDDPPSDATTEAAVDEFRSANQSMASDADFHDVLEEDERYGEPVEGNVPTSSTAGKIKKKKALQEAIFGRR